HCAAIDNATYVSYVPSPARESVHMPFGIGWRAVMVAFVGVGSLLLPTLRAPAPIRAPPGCVLRSRDTAACFTPPASRRCLFGTVGLGVVVWARDVGLGQREHKPARG